MEQKHTTPANNIVYSAMQPTNTPTIGNYLGAIKNWVAMQQDHECFYSIADLHSLTVFMDAATLRKNILDMYALLLACGISNDKCVFFKQSSVSEHSQLAWVLNCHTQFGEARRMTQFKEKSSKVNIKWVQNLKEQVLDLKDRVVNNDNVNVGLFAYPILQAADILLYNAGLVPIGQDQKQHLELSRNIAERFNQKYSPTFTVPEVLIPKVAAKINDLADPTKKMSKSSENPNSAIFMTDDNDAIVRKIKRAVTDSDGRVEYSDKKPGIANLLRIYAAFENISINEASKKFHDSNYANFKEAVAAIVVHHLEPIRNEYFRLKEDKQYLLDNMEKGAERARVVARKTMSKVYRKIGLN